MSNVSQWDTTAANNNSASPNGWPENMSPGGVNDSARENMAAHAKVYKDQKGSLVTGGSGTAYTLSTNNSHAALADIGFTVCRINTVNTGSATLAVDGLTAKTLQIRGANLNAGDLPQDVLISFAYNSTNDTFDVLSVGRSSLDANGNEFVLDADGDTSITADTDDQIDFKIGGVDELSLTAAKADQLDDIAGVTPTDGMILVGDGTDFVGESGATARTSLGLAIGTDVQAYSSVLANTTASFTTADETKLDAIEASADVTDEANVTTALNGATLTAVTVAGTDKVLVQDASDSDNLKTVTAQSIADLGVSGYVTISGTPADDDFAKFTSSSQVEGRSAAEVKTDLGFMTDLVDDTSPQFGGNCDGQDNELSRVNLKDYGEVTNAIGSIGGGTQDIDLTSGNSVTATVDTSTTTFTFSNPTASDEGCGFILKLTNGGSQTVNWPASVDWNAATAPTLTASGVDVLAFYTWDAGTTWYGFVLGQAMA